MKSIFPDPIRHLPQADVPLEGVVAFLSQSDTHQIIFMEFEKDVDVPEHSHAAQWAIVAEGEIELTIGGRRQLFSKGDRYYIPEGVKHSGKIHAGYADVTFFNEPGRYSVKIVAGDKKKGRARKRPPIVDEHFPARPRVFMPPAAPASTRSANAAAAYSSRFRG